MPMTASSNRCWPQRLQGGFGTTTTGFWIIQYCWNHLWPNIRELWLWKWKIFGLEKICNSNLLNVLSNNKNFVVVALVCEQWKYADDHKYIAYFEIAINSENKASIKMSKNQISYRFKSWIVEFIVRVLGDWFRYIESQ